MNVFDLFAKLSLNTSEYEEKLKKAKKVADVAGKAIKVSFAAIGTSAGAVGKVVYDSVSKYADFEQVRDGARKIFRDVDFNQITKDANNAFKDLNLSASEYFSAINQAGATFAQTMGNQKGYNMARKGMLAVSNYASGTGKSVQELTTKFQMITRASSSYQSIADQFSGILPQTSADFLKQATAAGYLTKSYKKLTEVPVAEYQEAVTKMLEKGVKDLGFMDNTLNESTRTLSGSLAMTRSAWRNFITGLSDDEADLGQLIDNLTFSAGKAFDNIVPVAQRAMRSLSKTVRTNLKPILKQGTKLIADTLPDVIDSAFELIDGFASALADNSDAVGDSVKKILDLAVDKIKNPSAVLNLIDAADSIVEVLINAITDRGNIADMSEGAVAIITRLAEFIGKNGSKLISVAPDIIFAIADGLTSADSISAYIRAAGAIIDGLAKSIPDAAVKLINAAPEILSNLSKGFDTEIPHFVGETLGKLMGNLASAITKLDWKSLIGLAFTVATGNLTGASAFLSNIFSSIGKDGATQFAIGFTEGVNESDYGFGKIQEKIQSGLGTATEVEEKFAKARKAAEDTQSALDAAREHWKAADGDINLIVNGLPPLMQDSAQQSANAWSNVPGVIGGYFDQIEADASKSGGDMVDNFASSAERKLYRIREVASAIASTIKSIVGFSEPEEGPLADFHTYAPDMIDLFSKGLEDNAYKLKNTVADTFDFRPQIDAGMTYTQDVSSDNGNQMDTVIALLQQIVPNMRKDIILDSGVLVSELLPQIDEGLGARSSYAGRNNA